MNKLMTLAEDASNNRGLTLILTKNKAHQFKTDLIANLILKGPLFVVSGDEWLPSFALTRIIRRRTTRVKEIMGHLYTLRASTCYRLWDSLSSIPSKGEPILVLEFFHTFYEADIPLRTRLIRLRDCCRELTRLAFYRPVIVMTQEMEIEDFEKFLPALSPFTNKTLTLKAEFKRIVQPAFF